MMVKWTRRALQRWLHMRAERRLRRELGLDRTVAGGIVRSVEVARWAEPEQGHERYVRIDDLSRERQREILQAAIRRLDLDGEV